MTFAIFGATGPVAGPTFGAIVVSQKPLEYGALGIYRRSMISGTMAAGLTASSPVYSWRWGVTPQLGVVQRVEIEGLGGTATAFEPGLASLRMFAARSFSVSDSAGTAGTLTGHNSKLRTSMGTTLLTDVRISSTTTLSAGTRTLDADAMGACVFAVGIIASETYLQNTAIFGEDPGVTMPYVCAQNEGFVIQASLPGTGTWHFGVATTHAEVLAF